MLQRHHKNAETHSCQWNIPAAMVQLRFERQHLQAGLALGSTNGTATPLQ
jgi:hypothetical protein